MDLDWHNEATLPQRKTELSIRAKSWGYEGDSDCYTGNYEMVVPRNGVKAIIDIDEICGRDTSNLTYQTVPIIEFGNALREFSRSKLTDFELTDFQIEELWRKWVITHNENHSLFIHKFSAEHKRYYKDMTGGFREYFFFTNNMIEGKTEKAIKINHPVVGTQWIPKSMTFTYHKSGAAAKTTSHKNYLEDLERRYGHTNVYETYVRRLTCNNFKGL